MYSKTLNVVTFRGIEKTYILDLRQFERDSEHIELCSSESHVSVDTALNLCTGEYGRMY